MAFYIATSATGVAATPFMPPSSSETFALRAAIERIVERVGAAALAKAAQALSEAYRATPDRPLAGAAMADDAGRVAYLVTRFPGTLAAVSLVAGEVAARLDLGGTRDLLELGAGPGPSLWALGPWLPNLRTARLVDADHRMLAVARELAAAAPLAAGAHVEFACEDLSRARGFGEADVVVASYALGELAEGARRRAVETAWAAARDTLILIEPGTSAGFGRIAGAREQLVALGARLVAPCPHQGACPMAAPDWCHFAARTERTRLHRQLKGGTLGYEDEKFSYVAATRRDAEPASGRLVARPKVHSGFVTLRACTRDGLRDETVSRKQGPRYRAARHAAWGDAWEG